MDFEGLSNSLGRQLSVVTDAPVPFAVAVILVSLLIWRALEWRYVAILERQREHIAHFERRLADEKSSPRTDACDPRSNLVEDNSLIARPRPRSRKRVFVPESVTPASLANMIKGLNGIQANRVTKPYEGKWLKVTAHIVTIEVIFGGEICVYLTPDLDVSLRERLETSLSAYFSEDSEGLDVLQPKDKITIIGEIQTIRKEALILTKCELAS
jgi:hypothetical protein